MVAVNAPFPLLYIFTKKLGQVTFKQLMVAICKNTYMVTTPADALKLLNATLALGLAHGRAISKTPVEDIEEPHTAPQEPETPAEGDQPQSPAFLKLVYNALKKKFPDVKVTTLTSRLVANLIAAKKATPQELGTALGLLFKELAHKKLSPKQTKTITDLEAGSPSPQIFSNKFGELLRSWKI